MGWEECLRRSICWPSANQWLKNGMKRSTAGQIGITDELGQIVQFGDMAGRASGEIVLDLMRRGVGIQRKDWKGAKS